MGIEVIDLRPDIFQMACGYFSLIIIYFQRASAMINRNLWMTGDVYTCIVSGCGQGQGMGNSKNKSFTLSPFPPAISHSPDLK